MASIAETCGALLSANGGYVMEQRIEEATRTRKWNLYDIEIIRVSRDHRQATLRFKDDGSVLRIDADLEQVAWGDEA